jgi:hypothetical protein
MHRNFKDKNDFLSFENRQTWNLICTKKAMMDDRILHLCTCENKHAKERMGSDVQMRFNEPKVLIHPSAISSEQCIAIQFIS